MHVDVSTLISYFPFCVPCKNILTILNKSSIFSERCIISLITILFFFTCYLVFKENTDQGKIHWMLLHCNHYRASPKKLVTICNRVRKLKWSVVFLPSGIDWIRDQIPNVHVFSLLFVLSKERQNQAFLFYLYRLLHLSKPGISTGVVPTAAAAAASLLSDGAGTTM